VSEIAVKVRLFATLRQQAGWKEREFAVPSGSTLGDTIKRVEALTPTLTLTGRTIYAAVNQSYAKMEHVLDDGDEVAIFPPVSGGRQHSRGGQDG
jgi:molybdopterin converting factor subunit 1